MATAPNGAPPKDQQQPPRLAPSTHALDNLQAMMNLVLVQSGRYLKELRIGDNTGRQAAQMKRAVPAAMERFHDSLDELENELHTAQAVLRRDLAAMQAARLKREQAEAAERERLAAESSAKKQTPVKPEPSPEEQKAVPAQPEPMAVDALPAQPETKEEPEKKEQTLPPPIDTTEQPERDPLFDPTPTTANPQDQEFDFDAMFGDSALDDPPRGDTSGDLNLDATGPDLDFTLDDSGPSLLPGLEDFAKDGDNGPSADAGGANDTIDLDFTMPDLPDLGAPAAPEEPQQDAPKPAEPTTTEQPADTSAGDDTNFDTLMSNDLDDLFNIDPDNPETTAFDDAFFSFDN